MNAPSPQELAAARRELRVEIARHRRRINSGLVNLEREGRKAISWRTQVARHPIAALGGAFGVGLAISSGLPRSGWWRKLAGWALRNAFAGAPTLLLQEVVAAFLNAAQSSRKS